MSSPTNLLIIGAGPNQVPAIRLAKQRGYRVVVTDIDPKAEGFALADETGLASTRDADATVAFARQSHAKHPLTGVMTMASESAVTVAKVAAALGLPGLNPAAAWRATHKVERQRCWRAAGIAAPRFDEARDLAGALKVAEQLGWPVVVKPVDSAGSRGVRKVNSPAEMGAAVAEIAEHSKRPEFLIEEFLTGSEHSIEGIVIDGQVTWCGFSDRNYDNKEIYPPYFLEDGDSMPTTLAAGRLAEVQALSTRAVKALGITWGPVKGDILVAQDGPRMIEMAARLSGDYFCYETIPLHNGINLLEAVMNQSVDLPVEPAMVQPKFHQGVALRYVWPKPGKVKAITGVEAVRKLPGVHFFKWEPRWRDIGVGTVINPARSMGERVGCVMTFAPTRAEAIRIAETACRMIKIETE
ncbi:MAG: Phosphoribosylamine--glycine ligase [Verrucomicrobiae bacterium]|nr:Phosphoribosylamine--glycine ligase [Verrucomicrobiae bacterium]